MSDDVETFEAELEAADSLVELIDLLVDPPVPEPISLAPQTAGWWIVGAILLLALSYGLRKAWLHWEENAYRREALAALDRAPDDPATIAAILRRTALAAYGRRDVAGLAGVEWLDFLTRTGDFPKSAGPALLRGPYAPDVDPGPLKAAAANWVRHHRRAS